MEKSELSRELKSVQEEMSREKKANNTERIHLQTQMETVEKQTETTIQDLKSQVLT